MRPRFVILVGSKCPACDSRGRGSKTGTYFGKTYDLPRWKRKPKCFNCRTKMVKLWEAKIPYEEVHYD